MLRSPLLSKTQAIRGACAAVVRPDGKGALSTCSMVNASAKQQTGKRTETTAAQRSGIFMAARLYSPSGAPSIRVRRNKIKESGDHLVTRPKYASYSSPKVRRKVGSSYNTTNR